MPRVQVVTPDGARGSVDEADVPNLPDGARVLTAEEIAQAKLEAEYEKASTASKVAGAVLGVGARHPQLQAYHEAATGGLTAGAHQAAVRVASDAIKPGAGKAYAERLADLETAYPATSTAGTVAGLAGGVAIGAAGGGAAGAGIARALPMNAAATLGAPVEHGVARALGGLATRGALGKAATQGAAMAVRGVAEGAAYAGAEQAAHDVTFDQPITGEKLYGAAGHGALMGGALGGALGLGGSLAGSAVRGLAGRGARAATRTAEAGGVPSAAPSPRGLEVPFVDAEAGLREAAPRAEDVFTMGAERRPVGLRPGGRPGKVATEEAIDITSRLSIDPDAGLFAPEGKVTEPLFSTFSQGSNRATRRAVVEAGLYEGAEKGHDVRLAADLFRKGNAKVQATSRPARRVFDIGIDPDAGIARRDSSGKFQGTFATEDAFKLSSAKRVPRNVDFAGGGEVGAVEARSPIRLPETPEAPGAAGTPKPSGLAGVLADPANAARELAHEQAWRAVGGGFGLQSTRYAKEAAKYFPGGTKDLGEVAMRFGLIDAGEAAGSPLSAAWQAAKSGTPADIAPRAAAASDAIGAKIGAITEASGARVPVSRVMGEVEAVARKYEGQAGRSSLVNATRGYGEELGAVLTPGRDGAVAIQDVLAQRKFLDDIVYEEAKTLDPRGRVKALREVRAKLESVITEALDEASGKVPGAQRAEYQALKKDYHALRILSEAAEDSSARASKGAMFGLGEKFAIGSALASGNIGAAPVLALGGKMIRERGNAAAAAFLSRAADQGTFRELVRRFDERISGSALGVLRDGRALGDARTAPTPASRRATARQAAASRVAAKEESAARRQRAQDVVRWVGEHNANPEASLEQIEEAAAMIGRAAGPKAAESYTAATVRAIRFIAAHVPIKERRDPLDPRSTPPLSNEEADRLLRATKYAVQPESIFEDFSRGVITPEGLRAAKTLVPESFAEFQLQLQEHVEDHMLRNRQLTQTQRLRIDMLLGYPAGADLRPKAIARLQANLAMNAPLDESAAPPAGPQGNGANPPLSMKIQHTGFDAIESRMAG